MDANLVEWDFDEVGNVTRGLEPVNHAGIAAPTYFTFDGLNRTVTVKDGLLFESYFGYDARSSMVLRVDADGRASYFEFDDAARVKRAGFQAPSPESPDAPLYYTYNQIGETVTVEDETGSFDQTFDKLGRLTKKATLTGGVYYAYDRSSMKTKMTSPDAVSGSYFDFDAAGRMVAAKSFDASSIRPATYEYDRSGLVKRSASPSNTLLSYFTYETATGRLAQKFDRKGSDFSIVSYFSHARDAEGQVVTTTHEAGENTYYAYDALDRVTNEDRKLGATPIYGFIYEFDKASNRTKKINTIPSPDVTTYFTYDARNRLASEDTL